MTAPRILVVDDEADLRELLEITLLKMGLDVDSADCLAAARTRLAGSEYALVLTDMRLPDGMGIDLVREVAAQFKNLEGGRFRLFIEAGRAGSTADDGAIGFAPCRSGEIVRAGRKPA
jgi:two-component system response regulator PilR (NtrC family)